jgi:DNA-binding MarR family transcriptional regulator/uncharacterized protein YbcV (DUF1398 family)
MKNHLKSHIGYWINRLRMYLHHSFEQRLKRHGVTVAQWCVLVSLYDCQAASVVELARYIEVDKAAISRVVADLAKIGLVTHSSGKDRRSWHVGLTPQSKKLVPRLIREAEENELTMFGHLSSEELRQLQLLLNKILSKIPTITCEGWEKVQEKNMNATEIIADILKQAKEGRWPYPKTFQLLKQAGVHSYKVKWGEGYEGIYHGTFGEWLEPAPSDFKPVKKMEIAFSQQRLKESIERHQRGETNFVTLLVELAEAGVSHYVVDMDKRTVKYFDAEEKHSYEEKVPTL